MAGKRIMIVEDEVIVSWALATTLESWGYTLTSIQSRGSDAINAFADQYPDLVLIDIFLADYVDGIQVAEYVKKTADIPFIFVTASKDADTLARAQAINPAAILSKPYNEFELQNIISGILH